MLIRNASIDDAEAIVYVNVETWITAYKGIVPDEVLIERKNNIKERALNMRMRMKEKGSNALVCEENGCVVGFATYGEERNNDPLYKGELYAIYFLEGYQKKGFGRKMLMTVVEKLIDMGINNMLIWALEDNTSCRFYEKMGGRVVRRKKLDIGGKYLEEVGYGWDDLGELMDNLQNI